MSVQPALQKRQPKLPIECGIPRRIKHNGLPRRKVSEMRILSSAASPVAIAQERLRILPDNLKRIELRRPFREQTATLLF